jgi:hypothetical protein
MTLVRTTHGARLIARQPRQSRRACASRALFSRELLGAVPASLIDRCGARQRSLSSRHLRWRELGGPRGRVALAAHGAARREATDRGVPIESFISGQLIARRYRTRVGVFPTDQHGLASPKVGVSRGLLGAPQPRRGFPGCCLDKPTWRYLTSPRRFSCICRFPLGFLSHVSRRERLSDLWGPRPREAGAACSPETRRRR